MGLLLSHNCTVTVYADMITVEYEEKMAAPPGGERSEISGFSKASRKRLFELLHSLEFERVLFITLTYPAEYPRDWQVYKAHLRAFRARLERKFGKVRTVWRLEYQKRGAPHYHLLLLDAPFIDKTWVSEAWYEIVASRDEKHLQAGTNVVNIDAKQGSALVASYIGKYVSKPGMEVEPNERSKTGRHWGRWNIEAPRSVSFTLEERQVERIGALLVSSRGSADTWRPSNYCSCTILGDSLGGNQFGKRAERLILYGEFPVAGRGHND